MYVLVFVSLNSLWWVLPQCWDWLCFVYNCECVFIYLIWVLDDALEVVLRF